VGADPFVKSGKQLRARKSGRLGEEGGSRRGGRGWECRRGGGGVWMGRWGRGGRDVEGVKMWGEGEICSGSYDRAGWYVGSADRGCWVDEGAGAGQRHSEDHTGGLR